MFGSLIWMLVKFIILVATLGYAFYYSEKIFKNRDKQDSRWDLAMIQSDPKAVAIYAGSLRIAQAIIFGLVIGAAYLSILQ